MTRVLVGDDGVDVAESRPDPNLVEIFRDIADLGTERERAFVPGWIFMKELAVFLERRTAAGGVDHVHVGTAAFERGDVALGQRASAIHFTGVDRDRTATAL